VETQVHGSLVELLGLGILLTGPSGIGKSECVLELVQRGHRMVADDVVRLTVLRSPDGGPGTLIGKSPESIRHHLEIRGVGLVSVPDLYGDESVVDESPVDLICHLERWNEGVEYERLGLDRPLERVAGVPIPALVIPVRPATSTASLVEVAGRDALLRQQGVNAARRLDERLRSEAKAEVEAGAHEREAKRK